MNDMIFFKLKSVFGFFPFVWLLKSKMLISKALENFKIMNLMSSHYQSNKTALDLFRKKLILFCLFPKLVETISENI